MHGKTGWFPLDAAELSAENHHNDKTVVIERDTTGGRCRMTDRFLPFRSVRAVTRSSIRTRRIRAAALCREKDAMERSVERGERSATPSPTSIQKNLFFFPPFSLNYVSYLFCLASPYPNRCDPYLHHFLPHPEQRNNNSAYSYMIYFSNLVNFAVNNTTTVVFFLSSSRIAPLPVSYYTLRVNSLPFSMSGKAYSSFLVYCSFYN